MSKENAIAFIDHLEELSVLTWDEGDRIYRVNPSFELKHDNVDGSITLIGSIIMDGNFMVLIDHAGEECAYPYFAFDKTEYRCHKEFAI